MTHKRYHRDTEILGSATDHAGVSLPDGVSVDDAADDLYARLGTAVKVDWQPWSPAEPVVPTDELPNGVSETDVEQALTDMKSEGML